MAGDYGGMMPGRYPGAFGGMPRVSGPDAEPRGPPRGSFPQGAQLDYGPLVYFMRIVAAGLKECAHRRYGWLGRSGSWLEWPSC